MNIRYPIYEGVYRILTLQDVADRRKIMYTYKGKLKYRPYPPGLTQEEVVDYRAGVIAVKI